MPHARCPLAKIRMARCLVVIAAFESPAVVSGLDDVTVMGQPGEQCGGHLGVAEHAWPFSEGEIGDDSDGSALVEPDDEM